MTMSPIHAVVLGYSAYIMWPIHPFLSFYMGLVAFAEAIRTFFPDKKG